jgi:osmotically-inducible protein OsmY
MAMLKLLFGAAAGFAAAWFLDPNDGTRRRNVARDKAFSYARKGKAGAARKADYAAGQAKGAASAVTPSSREPAEERLNDPALARKVETEVFRDEEIPKGNISVNAEYGVVYFRGEVPTPEVREELTARARAVDGVRAVENLTHLPGEPAPAKDEAREGAGLGQ